MIYLEFLPLEIISIALLLGIWRWEQCERFQLREDVSYEWSRGPESGGKPWDGSTSDKKAWHYIYNPKVPPIYLFPILYTLNPLRLILSEWTPWDTLESFLWILLLYTALVMENRAICSIICGILAYGRESSAMHCVSFLIGHSIVSLRLRLCHGLETYFSPIGFVSWIRHWCLPNLIYVIYSLVVTICLRMVYEWDLWLWYTIPGSPSPPPLGGLNAWWYMKSLVFERAGNLYITAYTIAPFILLIPLSYRLISQPLLAVQLYLATVLIINEKVQAYHIALVILILSLDWGIIEKNSKILLYMLIGGSACFFERVNRVLLLVREASNPNYAYGSQLLCTMVFGLSIVETAKTSLGMRGGDDGFC